MTHADHYHVINHGAELVVELHPDGWVADPPTFGTLDDAEGYVRLCATSGDAMDLHPCNDPRCAGQDPATGQPVHPEAVGYPDRLLRPGRTL
jgi:hypothetical protein